MALYNDKYNPKRLEKAVWLNSNELTTEDLIKKQYQMNDKDNDNGVTHIEIVKDTIRIEFSKASNEYIEFAKRFCDIENNDNNENVDNYLMPVKVENRLNIGAGCTVYLCRKKVSNFIQKQLPITKKYQKKLE